MSTQQLIKQQLLQGKTLTSCGAARTFTTADLRKYISNLRKSGMEIKDRRIVSGSGKWYKEYFIN